MCICWFIICIKHISLLFLKVCEIYTYGMGDVLRFSSGREITRSSLEKLTQSPVTSNSLFLDSLILLAIYLKT
jgi:hypothetical protein